MTRIAFALGVLGLLAATACDNGGTSSTTAPTAPQKTETFSGTVHMGGADFHNFTVSQTGEVDVDLTVAGPPATIQMGLGIGTGGDSCVLLSGGAITTPAGPVAQLSGSTGAGTYCVQVYDVGNQLGDVAYTVTVAHP